MRRSRSFKDPALQRWYAAMMRAAYDRKSELYLKDGGQHTGASHRVAFWHGYNGVPHKYQRNWPAYACYCAGQDFRARKGEQIVPAICKHKSDYATSPNRRGAIWSRTR